jgi:hypothetical protein
MDAIWRYKFLYEVSQVHACSERHIHVQNFDTGRRLILERNWSDDVIDTEHWNASMGF